VSTKRGTDQKKPLTKHHIFPRRFFKQKLTGNGNGEIVLICRSCHDELENSIPQKRRLPAQEYVDILILFCKFKGMVGMVRTLRDNLIIPESSQKLSYFNNKSVAMRRAARS